MNVGIKIILLWMKPTWTENKDQLKLFLTKGFWVFGYIDTSCWVLTNTNVVFWVFWAYGFDSRLIEPYGCNTCIQCDPCILCGPCIQYNHCGQCSMRPTQLKRPTWRMHPTRPIRPSWPIGCSLLSGCNQLDQCD